MKTFGEHSFPWRSKRNSLGPAWAGLCIALVCMVWFGEAAFAGTIKGRVITRTEERPKPPPRYYLGPFRSGRAPSVLEEGGPTDIVVYVEGAPAGSAAPPPVRKAQMEQKEETFVPHVLPVVAGTTVEFPNQDNFYHNVFSVIAGKRFDLGRYPQGQSARQTFTKPAISIVRCEIHHGMKAYIVVLENPYFTIPDQDGQFEIPNVPAGTYVIKAWHPTRPEQSRTVTVSGSDAVSVDFTF